MELRSRYCAYREDHQRTPCEVAQFDDALAKLGFIRKGEKWYGLRLKRTGEMIAEAMTVAQSEAALA